MDSVTAVCRKKTHYNLQNTNNKNNKHASKQTCFKIIEVEVGVLDPIRAVPIGPIDENIQVMKAVIG